MEKQILKFSKRLKVAYFFAHGLMINYTKFVEYETQLFFLVVLQKCMVYGEQRHEKLKNFASRLFAALRVKEFNSANWVWHRMKSHGAR